MKTIATKEKRSALAMSKARPYVHHPIGPALKAQQAEIHRILRSTGAQAKLTVGQPNDKYEQEADRVADQVMAMPDPKASYSSEPTLQRMTEEPQDDVEEDRIQRQELPEPEEEIKDAVQRMPDPAASHSSEPILQRKSNCSCGGSCPTCRTNSENPPVLMRKASSNESASFSPPSIVNDVVRSPGQPLDTATRSFMEPHFGRDFSQVRVHTDAKAAESARTVSAFAYTIGQDVVFGKGQYVPHSYSGRQLLAHELTHVVQQGGRENRIQRVRTHVLENDPSTAPTMSCPVATSSPVGVSLDATFTISSSILSPGDKAAVSNFVNNWHQTGVAEPVRIDGYASIDGTPSNNWPLSCRRAEILANELMTPSDGSPGIPAGSIELFAQGETDQFSSALEPNRRAQAHIPSVPTPTPPSSPPSPQFICGPKVTPELERSLTTVGASFDALTMDQKIDNCLALTLTLHGALWSWDVVELHHSNWVHQRYRRPNCATPGASPACGQSVQVGPECYFHGSPNYVLFGFAMSRCQASYGAAYPAVQHLFTKAATLDLVDEYKGPSSILGEGENWATSRSWAAAGYDGWPSGGTPPAGDRSGCDPSCAEPFTGPTFHARLCPNIPWGGCQGTR